MARFEVTIGLNTDLVGVGALKQMPSDTPRRRSDGAFAFVGHAPFDVTTTDEVVVRNGISVFLARPDRDARAGQYVELLVEDNVSGR